MATLLSISDFAEIELWKSLENISELPGGGDLTDYDGDPVNNYLLEGDRHYKKLVAEFGIAEEDLFDPITEQVKCKLVAWVSYCIARDAQEGKPIPLYDNIQEDKIDWYKVKKEDFYREYEACRVNAGDFGTIEDPGRFTLSIGKVSRTS